ncbi:hypothetical protein Tco_0694156, partial [Tanacetum coccineum]
MEVIHKLHDPQCELLLLRNCAGVAKLSYALRTCSPLYLLAAQILFDQVLRASLEKVVTASGSGFGDWQWRLATLPIKLGGLGILSAGDIIRLAIPMFSEGNLCPSCNAHQIDQWGDHAVHCSSEVGFLSKDGKDLRHADILLFNWLQVKDACLHVTCISPFAGMGATSWAPGGSLAQCHGKEKEFDTDALDTLSRIKSTSISQSNNDKTRKEVNIGLGGGRDKPLCPAEMLLYSWDGEPDVCVYLTGSLPLTQTGMIDFLPRRAVTEATQRKHEKYKAKCAKIGYGFLPFSFSSFGELERDAITLLKRIQKFSMTQDIWALPMFFECSLSQSCNAQRMDQWGDRMVQCSSEVGLKFRHNQVRDILDDICSKVGSWCARRVKWVSSRRMGRIYNLQTFYYLIGSKIVEYSSKADLIEIKYRTEDPCRDKSMTSGIRASLFEAMTNENEKIGASGNAVVDENQGQDDVRQNPKKRGTSKDVVASLDQRVAGVETSMTELKNQVEGLEGLDS